MKDYYDILEISPKASKEVIKQSYNALAKKYNPDKYQGEEKEFCEQKIREITEAYKILSDDFLKEQYDTEKNKETAKQKSVRNEYNNFEEQQQPNQTNNKKTKNKTEYQVGTLKSITHLTKKLITDIPKTGFKFDKKTVLSLLAAIFIVVLIGLALWFIPFTNGFMRSFLLMN